jgi:hypothetical protein
LLLVLFHESTQPLAHQFPSSASATVSLLNHSISRYHRDYPKRERLVGLEPFLSVTYTLLLDHMEILSVKSIAFRKVSFRVKNLVLDFETASKRRKEVERRLILRLEVMLVRYPGQTERGKIYRAPQLQFLLYRQGITWASAWCH